MQVILRLKTEPGTFHGHCSASQGVCKYILRLYELKAEVVCHLLELKLNARHHSILLPDLLDAMKRFVFEVATWRELNARNPDDCL